MCLVGPFWSLEGREVLGVADINRALGSSLSSAAAALLTTALATAFASALATALTTGTATPTLTTASPATALAAALSAAAHRSVMDVEVHHSHSLGRSLRLLLAALAVALVLIIGAAVHDKTLVLGSIDGLHLARSKQLAGRSLLLALLEVLLVGQAVVHNLLGDGVRLLGGGGGGLLALLLDDNRGFLGGGGLSDLSTELLLRAPVVAAGAALLDLLSSASIKPPNQRLPQKPSQ
jgi:hypothetical protein